MLLEVAEASKLRDPGDVSYPSPPDVRSLLEALRLHLLRPGSQSPQLLVPVPPQQLAVRPLLLPAGWFSMQLPSVCAHRTESAHIKEAVHNKINEKLGQTEVVKSRAQSDMPTEHLPT